jgi:hypothetical protein
LSCSFWRSDLIDAKPAHPPPVESGGEISGDMQAQPVAEKGKLLMKRAFL